MLKLEKHGFYYSATGDDALVLMAATGLKLKRDWICSFNAEHIDNVVKVLIEYRIPYSIERDGTLIINKGGNDKNYDWFLAHGKTIKQLQDEINKEAKRIRMTLRNANQI